jgi:hypothetical protein
MLMRAKRGMVFVHGIWADGSSFRVITSGGGTQGDGGPVRPRHTRGERVGATIYEVDTSRVPMPSQPAFVIDVIRTAAYAGARRT